MGRLDVHDRRHHYDCTGDYISTHDVRSYCGAATAEPGPQLQRQHVQPDTGNKW